MVDDTAGAEPAGRRRVNAREAGDFGPNRRSIRALGWRDPCEVEHRVDGRRRRAVGMSNELRDQQERHSEGENTAVRVDWHPQRPAYLLASDARTVRQSELRRTN